MHKALLMRVIALLSLFILPSWAFAHSYNLGGLHIGHPWTRATPGGADVAGGFLSITNSGTTDDRLIAVSIDGVTRVDIHEMTMDNGMMVMRPLKDGLVVPAGATVELKPGSFHIMMMGLSQPFKEGETVKATLTFEKAGQIAIDFKVEAPGSNPADKHQHGANTTTDQ